MQKSMQAFKILYDQLMLFASCNYATMLRSTTWIVAVALLGRLSDIGELIVQQVANTKTELAAHGRIKTSDIETRCCILGYGRS